MVGDRKDKEAIQSGKRGDNSFMNSTRLPVDAEVLCKHTTEFNCHIHTNQKCRRKKSVFTVLMKLELVFCSDGSSTTQAGLKLPVWWNKRGSPLVVSLLASQHCTLPAHPGHALCSSTLMTVKSAGRTAEKACSHLS